MPYFAVSFLLKREQCYDTIRFSLQDYYYFFEKETNSLQDYCYNSAEYSIFHELFLFFGIDKLSSCSMLFLLFDCPYHNL